MRLQDKVAVITGAATGIGRAAAVLFGKEGAKVVFGDVNEVEAEQTLRLAHEAGAEARYVRCDVRDPVQVENLVETAARAHGRLDVLFSNAGVNYYGKVHEIAEEDWNDCLSLNLAGHYRCMKFAIPHMLRQGGGSIILTASIQGLVAFERFAPYAAAKGGIVQLTRQAALDYAADKIRVNCLCPGSIRTPMNPEIMDPSLDGGARLERSSAMVPMGRVGEAEEIAHAALFLASDESAYITGHALSVDGGLVIKGR
jgi:NAD(P)-dependent dehydrogenase (short-subunit alcohol dehydrogenase family)